MLPGTFSKGATPDGVAPFFVKLMDELTNGDKAVEMKKPLRDEGVLLTGGALYHNHLHHSA